MSQNVLVDPTAAFAAKYQALVNILKHTADWSPIARSGLFSILFGSPVPIPPENLPLGCYPTDHHVLQRASGLTESQWSQHSTKILSIFTLKYAGTPRAHYQYPPLVSMCVDDLRYFQAYQKMLDKQESDKERKRKQRAREKKGGNHAVLL